MVTGVIKERTKTQTSMVMSEEMNEDPSFGKLSEYHQQKLFGHRQGGARKRRFNAKGGAVKERKSVT